MKIKGVFLAAILTAVLCVSGIVWAACPSYDLTGDWRVDLKDLDVMASGWPVSYDLIDFAGLANQWLDDCSFITT